MEENILDQQVSLDSLRILSSDQPPTWVALPLEHTAGIAFMPLDLKLLDTSIVLYPGEGIDIVGFPLGQAQSPGKRKSRLD